MQSTHRSASRRCLQALVLLGFCFLVGASPAQDFEPLRPPAPPPIPSLGAQKGFLPEQFTPETISVGEDSGPQIITPKTSYWLDADGNVRIEQLVARATSGALLFVKTDERTILNIHRQALWLRFEIEAHSTHERWLLDIGTPLADDAQLHWRDADGRWQVQSAGDVIERASWPLRTRVPTFELYQPDGKPTEYYLRLAHQRAPVSPSITLWQARDFHAAQQKTMFVLGGFFGLLTLVLVFSIGMSVVMRDAAFLWYSGYLAALGIFMFTNVGLSAQYLWPHSPILADRMVFVFACLTGALAPSFVRTILPPVVARRAVNATIPLMVIILLVLAAFEAFHPTPTSLALLNICTLISMALVYLLVYSAWQRGDSSTRWIAAGFVPVIVSVLPLILRNAGIIPNGFLTQYSLLMGSALEIPILLYALTVRSTRRRDNLMRSAGLPTEDTLTRLPNLRAFINHLHGVITRASRYGQNYGLLIIELSNEAWFAKEHRREVADRALVLLASRLQRISREVDLVSRIGANQFAMVIEGPCDARSMASWATRISAYGQKPNEVLPVGASLKVKITCALMPKAADLGYAADANEHLAWVIAHADDLPKDPKKTVLTLGF